MGDASKDTVSVLLNTSPPGLPAGTLGETFVKGTTAGTATIDITAPARKAVNGPVRIAFYAAPDLSLFDATQVGPSVGRTVHLNPGASEQIQVAPPSLASTPFAGDNLIAAVFAPDGSTTAVAGPMPAVTSLVASRIVPSPSNVAPGRILSVSLTLQNAGNVPVAGSAGLKISLSASPSGPNGAVAATMPLRVKLAAGRSGAYRVRFHVHRGTAAGSYYVTASLDVGALGDTNSADGTAVSAMPITVR